MSKHNSPKVSDLDELRRLLVQPEQDKIEAINQRLESPEHFVQQVGDILPQAMEHSAQQGRQLSEKMLPTVEEIVKLSIPIGGRLRRGIGRALTALELRRGRNRK